MSCCKPPVQPTKPPDLIRQFLARQLPRINYTQPNTSTPMQIQMTDNSSGSMVAEIHLSPRHVPRIGHIYVKGLRVSLDPVEYQVRLLGRVFFTENLWCFFFQNSKMFLQNVYENEQIFV